MIKLLILIISTLSYNLTFGTTLLVKKFKHKTIISVDSRMSQTDYNGLNTQTDYYDVSKLWNNGSIAFAMVGQYPSDLKDKLIAACEKNIKIEKLQFVFKSIVEDSYKRYLNSLSSYFFNPFLINLPSFNPIRESEIREYFVLTCVICVRNNRSVKMYSLKSQLENINWDYFNQPIRLSVVSPFKYGMSLNEIKQFGIFGMATSISSEDSAAILAVKEKNCVSLFSNLIKKQSVETPILVNGPVRTLIASKKKFELI